MKKWDAFHVLALSAFMNWCEVRIVTIDAGRVSLSGQTATVFDGEIGQN